MLTGTNLLYTKQYNLRIVVEVIRVLGPMSRAEIARRTSLTGQTVSNLVKELIELGLVHETARRRDGGRGAPSTELAINPAGAFAVGLDLNRDHLTGLLVDLAGTVRQRAHVELDTPSPPQALELMVEMVGSLMAREGVTQETVCGVGIGIPGPMYHAEDGDGYVVTPKCFPGWHKIPLARWVRERLSVRVHLENNATAAAVGERWYGAGQQIDTFFYLFFGSGLGGALVVDGRPYEGFTGNAGEVGLLPPTLAGGGDDSHVGIHFNLPRLYELLRADGVEARRPDDLDRLLAEGHPRLVAWMDTAANHLTEMLLAVEYLVDPEAVVFGGRLSDRMLTGFMERVARQLPGRRITENPGMPRHLLATAGSDAAALGVATLPIYEFFAPAPQVLLKEARRRSAPGLSVARMAARG
jgi:predicted NBD/HSP70 family sugar kinase